MWTFSCTFRLVRKPVLWGVTSKVALIFNNSVTLSLASPTRLSPPYHRQFVFPECISAPPWFRRKYFTGPPLNFICREGESSSLSLSRPRHYNFVALEFYIDLWHLMDVSIFTCLSLTDVPHVEVKEGFRIRQFLMKRWSHMRYVEWFETSNVTRFR